MKHSSKIPRKRKKMALYEVFSRGVSDARRKAGAKEAPSQSGSYSGQAGRGPGPRASMFQLNRGRVEISVRYELAIVVVLLVILCVMGAYRLGERMAVAGSESAQPPVNETAPAETSVSRSTAEPVESVSTAADEAEMTSGGDNWIVIATHRSREQLTPVQQYFMGYGIETQIRKLGDNYILHTKETYDNPNRRGSNGWLARQRIIEVGRNYESPMGYRSFDFSTAYGMKKTN